MRLVSEGVAKRLVNVRDAIEIVEGVFQALASGDAELFPVSHGHAAAPENRFGVKSGLIRSSGLVGLKVGTYWPENRRRGLPNHGSTTLLLDGSTGAAQSLVAATHLTALRTAAADAVAVKHLSREDARILAVVGAGHQAWHNVLAIRAVRPIERIAVWSRDGKSASAFAARATRELGLAADAVDLKTALANADLVTTATAACEALFPAGWIRAGTHISAMGADRAGKQELPVELMAGALLFADTVEQSISIGEFQAGFRKGAITPDAIRLIGGVIEGTRPGRLDAAQITIFDSSGTALQDLAIAAFALDRAEAAGELVEIDLT